MEILIWGFSEQNKKVQVSILQQTSANSFGHWKSFKTVSLNPFFSNLEIISPTYNNSTQEDKFKLERQLK
jgi:hypothetical protein